MQESKAHLWIFPAAGVFVGMADTGVQDVNPDFMRLGRCDFDILDLERLACGPADSSFASDWFSSGARHGGGKKEREL